MLGAVDAAEDRVVLFDSVPDHAAAAMIADRRECMDSALEAVERVRASVDLDLERLVVLVAAGFALGHGSPHWLLRLVNPPPARRFRLPDGTAAAALRLRLRKDDAPFQREVGQH